jgi:hypothetical protein
VAGATSPACSSRTEQPRPCARHGEARSTEPRATTVARAGEQPGRGEACLVVESWAAAVDLVLGSRWSWERWGVGEEGRRAGAGGDGTSPEETCRRGEERRRRRTESAEDHVGEMGIRVFC